MDPQPAGISREELQLAARNHGMPLEALRHEITPVGLHYLLVHYDIPAVGEEWRLRVDGRVRNPLELDLDAVRARPAVTPAGHDGVRRQRPRNDGAARDQPAVAAGGGGHG